MTCFKIRTKPYDYYAITAHSTIICTTKILKYSNSTSIRFFHYGTEKYSFIYWVYYFFT